MQAIVYKDDLGQEFETTEIPAELLEQAQEYHHQLIDTISHFDDEVLEAYIEDESSVTAEMIKRAVRIGTLADEITPGAARLRLQEQGRAAAARRGRRLPAEPARRPAGAGLRPEDRGRGRAAGRSERSVLGARLQGHVRPVRRQAHVLPRLLRHAQGRRPRPQHDHRQDRADQPHPPDAREPPRGARGDHGRRDRRRRRPQEHDDRRHALRRERADRARVDDLPRPGHLGRRRAEVEGRPGQARHRPRSASPRRIRPSASRPTRRRGRRSSPGWASCTSRSSSTASSASSTSTRTSAARRSRTARRRASDVENIREKFVRQTGGSGQYADVVINLRAAGAGRGLRVRRQDRRRQDPEGVHPRGRRRDPGGDAVGRHRGLPRRRRRHRARRRLVPRGRLERARIQDRRLDGLQGGAEALEAEAARADDGRRGDDAGGLPRRRDGEPQQPPRPDRVDGAGRQRPGRQGSRAAVGDVRILDRPAFDVAGPGRLPHGLRPVRGSSAVNRRRDHRTPAQAASEKGDRESHSWQSRSSSGRSRTSTSAPSVTSTTARRP